MNTPPLARIAARSKRQALDWSLVLASQDIHPVIAEPHETDGWGLLVDSAEYEKAISTIRQYRLENRGWAWKKELPGSELEIHSGAVFWCLLLAAFHWVTTFIAPQLVESGRMDGPAVLAGKWHRLFTPLLLHSDLAHLMANATFGVLMLGLAMARFGFGVTLLAVYVAGAVANIPGIFLYPAPYRNVGASGMMMAALGLLCIHSIGLWKRSPKAARYILSGAGAGVLLFVLFGLSPDSDVVAHLGGFLNGLLLGGILALVPEERLHRTGLNICALALTIGTIFLTWTLALR